MSPILPDGEFLGMVRRALSAGEPLPTGVLQPAVQRSWERARAAGMRPDDQALFQHYVSVHEMRRVQECHQNLIELARADMEQLLRAVRSPDWVVLLTDASGMIVHSLGSHEQAPKELRMPLRAGRRLHELELGTNAPAVVANEGIAAEVRGQEHFLAELRRFSCAAAPIFDLDGQVRGVLDITGFDVPWDGRMMDRVQIACRSIESRQFEQIAEGFLLRLHEDRRFLGTPAQGLLWLREDGTILAVNRVAESMLGLGMREGDRPRHVDQVFDWQNAVFRASALGTEGTGLAADSTPIYTHSGIRFFAHLQARASAGQGTARQRPPPRPFAPDPRQEHARPGTDPQWQAAFERASRVFPSGLPVLLQGETGTGKEWFARALHEAHRPGRPFVAINCAALAEGIAEAELFGHVEGAYTGSRKGGAAGRIEQAQGGTLFLDEIGDMPLHLQTRLLRVLQERSVTRVGSGQEVALDILVVAGSHRDLRQLIDQGGFREDLYFRLNGLKIHLPALRDRLDLDALIDTCLEQFSRQLRRPLSVGAGLRQRLHGYAWPGNIRQLRHALHVGALLASESGLIDEDAIALDHDPPGDPPAPPAATPAEASASVRGDVCADARANASEPGVDTVRALRGSLHRQRQASILEHLHAHGGNVSATARALRLSRTTLYKYLASMPRAPGAGKEV